MFVPVCDLVIIGFLCGVGGPFRCSDPVAWFSGTTLRCVRFLQICPSEDSTRYDLGVSAVVMTLPGE